MDISNINPSTGRPIKEKESGFDVSTSHGRLYFLILKASPLLKKILKSKPPIGLENVPSDQGYVLAFNHFGSLDPLKIGLTLQKPIFFIGRSQLFWWPMSIFVRRLGGIPVDRSRRNKRAVDYSVKILKSGGIISISPEGVVNRRPNIKPFKYGAVAMAQRSDSLILPVAIWKKMIKFGPPLKVGKDLNEANDRLRRSIDEMRTELYNNYISERKGRNAKKNSNTLV